MKNDISKGLSFEEAKKRLAQDGPNELSVDQHRQLLSIFYEVLTEPMFMLLLASGGIYLAMGDPHEAMILLGFVVVIMGITILQERRTENTLEALRDLSSPRALVVREGQPIRIPGREVVRDDILILSEGDRVPADGLVLEAHELAADESMLTGESVAVAKFADGETVFAGTMIVRGQGLIRVTATGSGTEFGRIGKSLQAVSLEASPLRKEIVSLTHRLALIGVAACLFLTGLYWMLRGNWLEAILSGITLAMGILPQEFPVIMIVFFAFGARRIASQRVLTRHLNAIETLGETTVLCVDKTGTLTQNRMTVATLAISGQILETQDIQAGDLPEIYHELLEYAVLASEIEPHDPMELAFHGFAKKYLMHTEHLHPDWILAREYELSPELLAMSHLWRNLSDKQDVVAAKGAPEAIADLCHLNEEASRDVLLQAEKMAARGLRVLGIAKASYAAHDAWPEIQHDFNFEFVGLVALMDPLRADVQGAIAECHQAGIRVVMITGDYPSTARAIAETAGIDSKTVLTGSDIARMDIETLASKIHSVNVFARVTPQQKLWLVEAFKLNGEVVAMTGDGVNDAPALKAAHIGIAMGKRGTDVAREAASLVLLEDDFSAIVAAIRLGRRIFENLRQALMYTIAVHIPIIGLAILPVLFGMPLVFAPLHIAFLELVIDPACSIVFEAETGKAHLMKKPPRAKTESLVSKSNILLSLTQGLLIMLVTAILYWWLLSRGHAVEMVRTIVFVVLVTANAALILPSRSLRPGLASMFSGMSVTGMVVLAGTLSGLIAITHLPVLAAAFDFKILSLDLWINAFLLGMAMLILFELVKLRYIRSADVV